MSTPYILSPELRRIVEAARILERPLLLKGEPGTGKTSLAYALAEMLGYDLLTWQVKSSTRAQDGLYTYDTVQRLNDARFGSGDVGDIKRYIKLGPLGQAFSADKPVVLLIDEIDKADLEFPNDLLHEIDVMDFVVIETNERIKAKHRPLIIITSNAERELPDAFLRRCLFHYIEFPDVQQMSEILMVHYPDLGDALLKNAMDKFFALRQIPGVRKKPSTSELIDWIRVLVAEKTDPNLIQEIRDLGILLKKDTDINRVQKFLRERGLGGNP